MGKHGRFGWTLWICVVLAEGGSPRKAPQARMAQQDDFELCAHRAHIAHARVPGVPRSSLVSTTSYITSGCEPGTQIPIVTESQCAQDPAACEGFCCPAQALWCAGCGNASQAGCHDCAGGFVNLDETGSPANTRCEACMDTPGWVNKAGQSCVQLETSDCTDEEYHFLSANMACCQCGGGHRQATTFTYFTRTLVLGERPSDTLGHPVPRTAAHYSVNADCPLLDHNLTLNASTGQVELSGSCETVGCGSDEPFTVSCLVTAHQSEVLNFTSNLVVHASKLVYGSDNILLVPRGSGVATFDPQSSFGMVGGDAFSMACVPSAETPWLSFDAGNGTIRIAPDLAPNNTYGITDINVPGLALSHGSGLHCQVVGRISQTQPVEASLLILVPTPWSSVAWTNPHIRQTIGVEAPPTIPSDASKRQWSLPPTSFTAACTCDVEDVVFAFDVLTGQATLDGHDVFALEPTSGIVLPNGNSSLSYLLDKGDANRHSLSLSCVVFGHYDWQVGRRITVKGNLSVQINDDTCWKPLVSSAWRVAEQVEAESCKSECRRRANCSHFTVDGETCLFLSARCNALSGCQVYANVTEKIPRCSERVTCLHFNVDNQFYAGTYCPAIADSNGDAIYLHDGVTQRDAHYLVPFRQSQYNITNITCEDGSFVLKSSDPSDDFLDPDVNNSRLELHGKDLACIKGTAAGELLALVFSHGRQLVSIASHSFVGANASFLELDGGECSAPNLTSNTIDGDPGANGEFSAVIVDDVSTVEPADFSLHPCECLPPAWESEAQEESSAEHKVQQFLIAQGAYTCNQVDLLQFFQLDDREIPLDLCAASCRALEDCNFFWAGAASGASQCKLYRECRFLVREVGAEGSLYGMPPSREMCRKSDPEACWSTTVRRRMLGASVSSILQPGGRCVFQEQLEHCDWQLLIGGTGIQECGKCDYAFADSHSWRHKKPLQGPFRPGTTLELSCWHEYYSAVPGDNEEGALQRAQNQLTCLGGEWIAETSSFACAACVQLVRAPYAALQDAEKQELYFAARHEMQFLIDTKTSHMLDRHGKLVAASLNERRWLGSVMLHDPHENRSWLAGASAFLSSRDVLSSYQHFSVDSTASEAGVTFRVLAPQGDELSGKCFWPEDFSPRVAGHVGFGDCADDNARWCVSPEGLWSSKSGALCLQTTEEGREVGVSLCSWDRATRYVTEAVGSASSIQLEVAEELGFAEELIPESAEDETEDVAAQLCIKTVKRTMPRVPIGFVLESGEEAACLGTVLEIEGAVDSDCPIDSTEGCLEHCAIHCWLHQKCAGFSHSWFFDGNYKPCTFYENISDTESEAGSVCVSKIPKQAPKLCHVPKEKASTGGFLLHIPDPKDGQVWRLESSEKRSQCLSVDGGEFVSETCSDGRKQMLDIPELTKFVTVSLLDAYTAHAPERSRSSLD